MKMIALPQRCAIFLAAILEFSSAARGEEQPGTPLVMASVGDSISVAFDAFFPLINLPLSWAAGSDKKRRVNSHYSRLSEIHSSVKAYNLATPGAPSSNVLRQMKTLRGQLGETKLDYLTVMVGANDVCSWPENHAPYLERYKENIRKTLAIARDLNPKVKVLLVPTPNLTRLYHIGQAKGCGWKWYIYPMCNPLLRSKTPEERTAFESRMVDMNRALETLAREQGDIAQFALVDEAEFTNEDLSWLDCFHPSTKGQQTLSNLTWDQGWYKDVSRLADGAEN